MDRKQQAGSWSLVWKTWADGSRKASVRFRHGGKRVVIPTGCTDGGKAKAEAARLYAAYVQFGSRPRTRQARALTVEALPDLFARWIDATRGQYAERTPVQLESYALKLSTFFHNDLSELLNTALLLDYKNERLKHVMAKTVRKELSCARVFLEWCKDSKLIETIPEMPLIRKRIRGNRTGPHREKAQELTEFQVEAVLTALPEQMGAGHGNTITFPCRARFILEYETGLRPSTLSKLVWGDWDGPQQQLVIRDIIDKNKFGRPLPLSPRAQAALESIVPETYAKKDLIFGSHDYRSQLAKAAEAAGLTTVCGYDLRHAFASHTLARTGNLAGVSYMLGHRNITTTARYVHVNLHSAERLWDLVPPRIPVSRSGSNGAPPKRLIESSAKDEG